MNALWQRYQRPILILIAIIVVLLGLGLWWILRDQRPPDVLLNNGTANQPTNAVTNSDQIQPPVGGEAVVAARNFAERYGSYSNQNPYDNIKQLFPLMTEHLRQALSAGTTKPSDRYQGVESRVVSVKTSKQSATTSTIVLTLQRSERDASLKTTTYFQQLELQLIKSADQWLVDSADWLQK